MHITNMKRLPGLALAAVALASVGLAQRPAPGNNVTSVTDLPKLSFEKYTLPNGLDVILSEDHRLPRVAVNLWYHVGPANEEPGRTGFAHLFEHMMFQGSKHVPANMHFKMLEGAGASGINGTTDFDRTNYFETLPASELELALWLESDRMGYQIDKLDQANLSNQQDVVRNERRQSVENQPYGIVEEALYHALFPQAHPYYASVIGSHADIQAARLDDVKKFFKLYYAPNNASLAIVGDIDKATTRRLVEKYFGPLKKGADVPPLRVETPSITAERRLVVKDHVELPRVYVAWLTPTIFSPGDAEANIAANILGRGKSSRLYEKLVYEQQIAQDVTAGQTSLTLGSVFDIAVTARPGHTAEEIQAALDKELDRFRDEGPDSTEVERARNGIETRMVQRLEAIGGFGGVSDRLNMYNHYRHDPDYLAKDIGRYRAVTPDAVRRFAREHLATAHRVVVDAESGPPDLGVPVPTPSAQKSTPGEGADAVNADQPWRAEMPKPAPEKPLQLPIPQTFKLANGLTVIYLQRPGLPVVAANLIIRTGSDANPLEKPGLANFTVGMLNGGTATRNARQIADEAAYLGATLSTSSTMDASLVTVRSLKTKFASALNLLADVALHPSFPQEEIDRERSSRLASLVQQRESAPAVADRVMAAALYGPRHPYGFTELGTEAAVKAIGRGDMQAFWHQSFVPNNAALVVVGAIERAELKALAEKTFGSWRPGASSRRPLGEPATTAARLVLVDKPGAPQTQLRVATIGASRSIPDFPAVETMNTTLGGMFSSRINMNLREVHGYTYGANSRFVFRRGAGPFLVSSGIRTDVTAPAVTEILKEIGRITEAPVTGDELALAKGRLMLSLPSEFETSDRAAAGISNLYIYDLGLDYYARSPGRVASVDGAEVQSVARKYLVPAKMIVVAVGDRAKIEPELTKLNLGPIAILDTEGNVKSQGATR